MYKNNKSNMEDKRLSKIASNSNQNQLRFIGDGIKMHVLVKSLGNKRRNGFTEYV
jgi:hypothetical protein